MTHPKSTCSVHQSYASDDDPSGIADKAAQRLAEGVDVVVFTMTTPYDVSMVSALAEQLAARE